MASLFSKPKSQDPPPVPGPEAIPEVADETGDFATKQAKKRSGFRKTILTGSLTPNTGKKQVLG